MKRLVCFLIIIGFLPSLTGCGSIYANFREVEDLLVIQALGLDRLPGGIQATLASAQEEREPVCMSGVGASVTAALERANNYSGDERLFFAHINGVLLGEGAARQGIGEYLSYMCRSTDLIIDMPVFIVRGSTANALMTGIGESGKSAADMLQGIRASRVSGGGSRIFTAVGILRYLARGGSALVTALEAGTAADGLSEGMIVVVAGYAIIKDEKLCGYLDRADADAASLLLNSPGRFDVLVRDSGGASVTLQVSDGSAGILPVWGEDGSLTGIDVSVKVSASLVEKSAFGEVNDGEYADRLISALESEIAGRIRSVLQKSRELEADFLGLGSLVELTSPLAYRRMPESFLSRLPQLELRIRVSGALGHTNDIKDA